MSAPLCLKRILDMLFSWQQMFSILVYLNMSLFTFIFWGIFLAGHRNLECFSTLQMSLVFWSLLFLKRTGHYSYFSCDVFFYLSAFKIFALSLVLTGLTMACLALIFLVFILVWFLWVSWIYKLVLTKFGTILATISLNVFFFLFVCLPSFWDSSYMYVGPIDIVSIGHYVSLIKIFSLFLTLENWYSLFSYLVCFLLLFLMCC